MYKNYNLTLDTTRNEKNTLLYVNTNDLQTFTLSITVTQHGEPIDLTGTTPRIAILKPDKNTVFQDCALTDAENGKCEVTLDTQAYIVAGQHYAELMIYDGADTVAVTSRFVYNANKGILDDGSIESTTEWQSITQAINDTEAILVDLRENGTGVDTEARDDIVGLTSELAEKATKEELNSLGQLQLSGTYATLTDLQNAHPTGTTGLFLVTGDGFTYRWDGSAWVQAVKFQSTGIADKTITPMKTTFIEASVNIFNIDSEHNVTGAFINTGGNISQYSGTNYSHLITVSSGEVIRTKENSTYSIDKKGAYYDRNGNYINMITGVTVIDNYIEFTVPENTEIQFVKINYKVNADWMFVKNTTYPSSYVPYWVKLEPSIQISESQITAGSTEKEVTTVITPSKVFVVANDILSDFAKARQYSSSLYLDHIFNTDQDKEMKFVDFPAGEGDKYYFYHPSEHDLINNGNNIDTSTKTIKVSSNRYSVSDKAVSQISTKASVSKVQSPRVLFIGDSITQGVGAREGNGNGEHPYWMYVKKLFELDKIDGGDNPGEYNFMGLGVKVSREIEIDYKGVTRNVRACADGQASWSLFNILHHSRLLTPSQTTWDALGLGDGSGTDYTGTQEQKDLIASTNEDNAASEPANPYFDNAKTGSSKFSITKWLERYRTRDDAGNKLTLDDPNLGTFITTQEQIDKYNVCTPTHVVMAYGRNDLSYTSSSKFIENEELFIDTIKSELPNVIVGICTVPDRPGTFFPNRYPQILGNVSLSPGRNEHKNVEDQIIAFDNREAEDIYLIPNYFTQPTAWGMMLQDVSLPQSFLGIDGWQQESFRRYRPLGNGLNNHLGSQAHTAWGYQVYAWLKYVLSK